MVDSTEKMYDKILKNADLGVAKESQIKHFLENVEHLVNFNN